MHRHQLIDEKHEVQAQIRTLRSRVEHARRKAATRRERARVEEMEHELEALMARETELRRAIDRTSW